jgi:hypothetical protein
MDSSPVSRSHTHQIETRAQEGLSTSAIAKRLKSSRTPVRRLLGQV